jgi:hypothetical protein
MCGINKTCAPSYLVPLIQIKALVLNLQLNFDLQIVKSSLLRSECFHCNRLLNFIAFIINGYYHFQNIEFYLFSFQVEGSEEEEDSVVEEVLFQYLLRLFFVQL